METTEKKDVMAIFKYEKQALAVGAPEYLAKYQGVQAGADNFDKDDIIIPRLSIAQDGMTSRLKKSSEDYDENLSAGDLFNSVTGEIYGTEVHVVPLIFFKNYIKFKPGGGGVEAMFTKKEDIPPDQLEFVKGVAPAVTEFKNRLCLLIREGHKPIPMVVSFKSTGLKFAKQWNSQIRDTGLPAFAKAYTLSTFERQRGTQSWFLCRVLPYCFVPEDFFNAAKATFERFEERGIKVDTTGLDESEQTEKGVVSDEDIPF